MKYDLHEYHRFLDEAGDTTFYGKGKINIVGQTGVSNVFIIGMVRFHEPLQRIRDLINDLCSDVLKNSYYNRIPSVMKRAETGRFYFHAKDDIPELRKEFYDLISGINCSFQAVVGRKIVNIYEKKHNGAGNEFYADLLSHLIKDKLGKYDKLVFNIAQRKNSTEYNNLQKALKKANDRFRSNNPEKDSRANIKFNVVSYADEPLLALADYLCWSIQRIFEKGETRFYDYVFDKISLVVDLYDSSKYSGNKNYYNKYNRLTVENKISSC